MCGKGLQGSLVRAPGRTESSSTEMEQRLQVEQVWGEGKDFRGGHVAFDMLKSLFRSTGRSPRERNGNPLQYSCLVYIMDRGAWGAVASPSDPVLDPVCCSLRSWCLPSPHSPKHHLKPPHLLPEGSTLRRGRQWPGLGLLGAPQVHVGISFWLSSAENILDFRVSASQPWPLLAVRAMFPRILLEMHGWEVGKDRVAEIPRPGASDLFLSQSLENSPFM